jgi:hypothetical protein
METSPPTRPSLDETRTRSELLVVEPADQLAFLETMRVTDSEIEAAASVKQRSPEWYEWRKDRLSASVFGNAIGHVPKDCSARSQMEKVIRRMMWPGMREDDDDAPREPLMYGQVTERHGIMIAGTKIVRDLRKQGYRHVWIEETGTRICKEHPWLSASSDGLVYGVGGTREAPMVLRGTLEHKSPFYKKQFYPIAPPYYYDQFQGTAAILEVEHIYFTIYTPPKTEVSYFAFNRLYWERELFPKLRDFYMREYVWRAVLRNRGLIRPGCIAPDPSPLSSVWMNADKSGSQDEPIFIAD